MLNRLAGVVSESLSTTKTISTLVVARLPTKFVGVFFLVSTVMLLTQLNLAGIHSEKAFVESAINNLPHLNAGIGPLETKETKVKTTKPKAKPIPKKTINNPVNQNVNYTQNSALIAEFSKPQTLKTPDGTLKYSKKLNVFATSYDPNCPGCSGTTALGLKAGYGVIAVDPNIIPLGSKVYVPGYGVAVAGDTGGAIKGNVVDLGFDNIQSGWWSSRHTDLYILTN
jgi:3D (Asp-Asp-Asp) domain-containing protein